MQVLIVDDDPVQRLLLRRQLIALGYTVQTASDGMLAWEVLQREPISLVITDWMMPNIDGPELIRRIRVGNLPGYTYIILLTVKHDREDIVIGLDAGADDYLTKPCDPHELRARMAIGARIVDLEAQLRAARDTDQLTGLRNRRAIMVAAESALAQAQRAGRTMSVILLDIDHFKHVNDHHGHRAGDLVLQLVAQSINHVTRPYDVVGRWGGEELLLVLPDCGVTEAIAAAERIRASIAAIRVPLESGQDVAITASLGVTSVLPAIAERLDALIHTADLALYRAKAAGRNQVCCLPHE